MSDAPDLPVDADEEAMATIDALLSERSAGATICPSEAARRLSPDDWRQRMPTVHRAVGILIANGRIVTTWRGQPVAPGPGAGPYRIRRREQS